MLEVAGSAAASSGSSNQLWQWKALTAKSAKCSAKKTCAAANEASTSAGVSGPDRGMWVESTQASVAAAPGSRGSRWRLNWSRPSQ